MGGVTGPGAGRGVPAGVPTGDPRRARLVLSRLAEPGDAALGGRIRRVGPVRTLEELVDGSSPLTHADRLRTRLPAADPEPDLARAESIGARLLVPGDREWPTQLGDLGDEAPLLLWAWGTADLRLLAVRSVAVVGARACTAYGEAVARELGADLAERGWAVVSGGAYGIDVAAHRGALAAGGVTACVLAGGVDVPYPRAHEALLARIVECGVVLSESPPGSASLRTRFLSRNRLIAALTRATVVVEAAARSGTTSTAGAAAHMNRPVLGVPGPVTSPMSAGVHRLIRDGVAVLVTGCDEILEVAGDMGVDAVARAEATADPLGGLSVAERRVYDALPMRRGVDLDALVVAAGLPPREVMRGLGILEAAGLALRHDDGRWGKPRPVGPARSRGAAGRVP